MLNSGQINRGNNPMSMRTCDGSVGFEGGNGDQPWPCAPCDLTPADQAAQTATEYPPFDPLAA
eukprot:1404996-Lingulodinium_polyedra.AAC.1